MFSDMIRKRGGRTTTVHNEETMILLNNLCLLSSGKTAEEVEEEAKGLMEYTTISDSAFEDSYMGEKEGEDEEEEEMNNGGEIRVPNEEEDEENNNRREDDLSYTIEELKDNQNDLHISSNQTSSHHMVHTSSSSPSPGLSYGSVPVAFYSTPSSGENKMQDFIDQESNQNSQDEMKVPPPTTNQNPGSSTPGPYDSPNSSSVKKPTPNTTTTTNDTTIITNTNTNNSSSSSSVNRKSLDRRGTMGIGEDWEEIKKDVKKEDGKESED